MSRSGWLPVAPLADLAEGETLRVDFDGVVVAIALLEGQLFAFQEFCTHRFGPLSEGSFHNGEVQCPWHGSCFDVRTGKVTRGPAKVNLKTYRVLVTDGTIHIDLQPAVPPERERVREMAAGNGRRQKEAVGARE
jgi:nitrite reductase/ring-hydroxylating ferredoxin subunit